ncbi:hypothetical protein PL9631_120017 [Planktothrix paucivesiculata PCC 9631]|uniref:Uncharacterized protein n=1 Tax=Planktothrix paucivesiculata PCC 9631 TaxID=671071 RepID=A0A7Z9BJL8_9CYAN|nr:hypothetical protein PL9631_120017 [Planktothrix paucivesiculata PCC 9631]
MVFLVDVLPNFAVYSDSGNLEGDFGGLGCVHSWVCQRQNPDQCYLWGSNNNL